MDSKTNSRKCRAYTATSTKTGDSIYHEIKSVTGIEVHVQMENYKCFLR